MIEAIDVRFGYGPHDVLDIEHGIEVMDTLRSLADRGTAVIVSIHDLNTAARYCDRFVMLANGKVHATGGKEFLSPANIEAVYGISAKVLHDPEAGTVIVPISARKRSPECPTTGPDSGKRTPYDPCVPSIRHPKGEQTT